MTPLLIQNALVSFLEEHLSDLLMDGPVKAPGPPRIFRDALPPSLEDEEVYPFIIVRWLEGEDSVFEDSMETFALIVGVFGDDEAGGEYAAAVSGQWAMAVVTRLRRLLGENQILAGTYELQFPLRSQKAAPEKQQNRYLLATVTTKWSAPAPVQIMEA
ncbi:hypothetical protein LF599_04635 [Pseudodesulfovibrio thermohalotolerans]|uniref:hypothetical protein n=1 Tax=Pseudodesulfovibrio thermohalotolerans TaxID=2880651 RepID=UPI002441C235|nr:hypothetical protein [Pseudodesulfovibrio thermohalotolerans]WFS63455.1 hypothetical protein LF599_04635 [Pseudodesulfovibrio thermohalotolerans]